MVYNVPAFTSFLDLFVYANTETSGIFGAMVMVSFYFLVIFSMEKNGLEHALAVASVFSVVLAVAFAATGITTSDSIYAYVIGILLLSIILLWISKKRYRGF